MKIYDTLDRGPTGQHTVYVTPGKLDSSATNADWYGEDGKPVQVAVRFTNGRADVDDSLGRLLIHHKLARKSRPLFQPA